MMSELNRVNETIDFVRKRTPFKPRVGITLGSGLAAFGASVQVESEISFSDLPHFPLPLLMGTRESSSWEGSEKPQSPFYRVAYTTTKVTHQRTLFYQRGF